VAIGVRSVSVCVFGFRERKLSFDFHLDLEARESVGFRV